MELPLKLSDGDPPFLPHWDPSIEVKILDIFGNPRFSTTSSYPIGTKFYQHVVW